MLVWQFIPCTITYTWCMQHNLVETFDSGNLSCLGSQLNYQKKMKKHGVLLKYPVLWTYLACLMFEHFHNRWRGKVKSWFRQIMTNRTGSKVTQRQLESVVCFNIPTVSHKKVFSVWQFIPWTINETWCMHHNLVETFDLGSLLRVASHKVGYKENEKA